MSYGVTSFMTSANRISTAANVSDVGDAADGVNTFLAKYLRKQFYENLRTYYLNAIKDGKIQRASYSSQALLNSIDEALDFTSDPLCDWKILNTINHIGFISEAAG